MMMSGSVRRATNGFTLVEILAALAIGSVVIYGCTTLVHTFAWTFDRGTNRVANGERLALASERIDADIAAARFAIQAGAGAPTAAFHGDATQIIFVASSTRDPGLQIAGRPAGASQIISLSIVPHGEATEIVRRRAPWSGPRMPIETAVLGDPVILLDGDFDASFQFGAMPPKGGLSWSETWTDQPILPRLVRLSVRDRMSGLDLLGGGEVAVRADAPPACAHGDAAASCLSGDKAAATKQASAAGAAPALSGIGNP